jgi:mono/diheme cytochrome c family protein
MSRNPKSGIRSPASGLEAYTGDRFEMRRLPFVLYGVLCLTASARAESSPDFSRDIQPIFQRRCYVCHGPQVQMKGLRFDDRQAAMRAIQPGDSAHSRLIAMATGVGGKFMPPTGPRLSADEVALLRAWIDRGAPWPEAAARSGLWSLQATRNPAPPAVRNRAWPVNGIDNFVLARLEAERIEPSPAADRATLIRRLSLDLTGLPPAPQEVETFLADTRPDAYQRLVDRLLDSPHYGEKWARYWLDLAHYADSDGYEKDLERPWAWRYRQWVIAAFNRDMPYDEFTIEQIAGDELPHATVEQKVAT